LIPQGTGYNKDVQKRTKVKTGPVVARRPPARKPTEREVDRAGAATSEKRLLRPAGRRVGHEQLMRRLGYEVVD
jgi:hypothetical protein